MGELADLPIVLDRALLLEVGTRVLPGFGVFGPDGLTSLSVPIGTCIDRVLLSIAAPGPQFLNLIAPEFYDGSGKQIPREEIYASVTLSSKHSSVENGDLLSLALSGALLHTNQELCPAMDVRLKKPALVGHMTVLNRPGIYHRRSRFLTIHAFNQGGCRVSYDTADPSRLINTLLSVMRRLDIQIPESSQDFDADDLTDIIRTRIKVAADDASLGLPLRRIPELLPMFSDTKRSNDYNEAICASMVVEHLGNREHAGTKELRVLEQFLNSPEAIERIRGKASHIAERKFGRARELTLSKHRVHYARLIEQRDAYLNALDRVFATFKELNIALVLSYGTLLGAVREGTFLPHDDDVDLLYVDGSQSQGEMQRRQLELAAALSKAGFRVDVMPNGKNFHINTEGVSLDLFPSWLEDDRLQLLMEQMRFRSIPQSIVLSESRVNLHGRAYPAPADPSAFLEERYGPSWRVPDIYYDWPWKVNKRSDASERVVSPKE